jgi:hypothetical protein
MRRVKAIIPETAREPAEDSVAADGDGEDVG